MRRDDGFTLIELLTVMAIIGALAAIALPQFALYRQRGFDARSESDLRNAAAAEEAMYAADETYVSCADAASCQTSLPGYKNSTGVKLSIRATTNVFTGTSSHDSGSKMWTYDSTVGRFVFSNGP